MFKKSLNSLGYILLASALIFFSGCGGSESGIEGEEEVIAVELTVHDDGDSESTPTLQIDVASHLCETVVVTPDPNNPNEPPVSQETYENSSQFNADTEASDQETLYDTYGMATFHYVFYCPTCPPGAEETYIIDSYTVEYIPIRSPNGFGGYFIPPKLVDLNRPILSQIVLTREFSEVGRGIMLMPLHTKVEYVRKMLDRGGYDTEFAIPFFGLYSIRVTFHGRNRTGGNITLVTTTEVSLGDYDTCE